MISPEQAQSLVDAQVMGPDAGKIGKVGQVFLDDETGVPEWVTVKTGLFGGRESFVPLAEASMSSGELRVPYDKDRIKGAPSVETDADLSQDEEASLYRYYGLGYTERTSDSGLPTGTSGAGMTDDTSGMATSAPQAGTVGRDTSGPTTDDAMTRSEERLRVGVQRMRAGQVKLRKFITTEAVQTTVPVEREQVRVTREPVTEATMAKAMDGPELSEEEHEVVLTETRPVVEKEVVPVERVRLAKDEVVEQVTVSDQVRKEVIDVDDAGTVRSS